MLQNEGTLCTCVWCVCVCVVAHDRWQSSKLRSTGRVKPGTKAEKCRDVFFLTSFFLVSFLAFSLLL